MQNGRFAGRHSRPGAGLVWLGHSVACSWQFGAEVSVNAWL
jgi:hypothetical protein